MKHLYINLILMLLMCISIKTNAQITKVNEDFDVLMVPTGWANALNSGPILSRVTTVQSYGRTGTTAAIRSNNYNDPNFGGSRATLETPVFTASVSGDSVRFDVAHATYTGGEQDSLIVHAFNGTSYTRIGAWGSSPTIDLTGITTAPAQTAEFVPGAAQWLTKKISLPVGTTRIQFEFYSDFGNQLYLDKVLVDSSVVQTYVSSTTTQTNTTSVLQGATNQEIIGIQVVTNGNNPLLSITDFQLHTGSSTSASTDIVSAKLYSTGNTATFSTANLYGSFSSPNGAFAITGSSALLHGTNYFWLVYDIAATAANSNIVDARCDSVMVDGIYRIPTIQNPTGSRAVSAPNQVLISATSGTTTGIYATLKDAFDKINDGTHQGDITVTIANSTTEMTTAVLNRSGSALTSYTSVHISPSANVTIQGNITGSLIHLKGTNNVTIDGRIGATGPNALTLINNSSLTNTAVIQLSSLGSGMGATSNTISYCNIKAGTFANLINTFGIYIADSTISNTATGLNNNYNNIVGNTIQKCRYGIYNRGSATSSAVYNKSIVIASNKIGSLTDSLTVSFIGIDSRNNDSLNIESNEIIGMLETNQTAIVRAIELGGNIINSTIVRNTIDQIKNSTTTLFRSGQGIFIATVASSNNLIANNVISNLNGHGSGTFTNNVWGIFVSSGGGIKILFNTIALTGSATTTGSADRSGCLLLNSASSTAIEVRGNIFYNTRFPGNNATGFSECVHSLTTAINLNINYNIYYVVPSNVRYIVGVLAGDRSTLANWQTATTQDVNSLSVNPLIATSNLCMISPSSAAIGGGPTGTGISIDILGTTRGATPTIGAYETGVSIIDLQPTKIYTLGKLPIPYSNPHTLRASISNLGNDTAFTSKAYVSVNGVNTILDSLMIPPIAPGAFITVDMPAYSYINMGVDTVVVSVEADANNSNNFSTPLIQVINSNTYSYAEPFRPADGGVGFNGATGDFVAKFPYTGSNSINQIGVNFSAGGQTLSIGIWDTSATGGPGVNLWTSTPFTTVTGLNTIVVNPPIPISGSFFVGVRQTGTTNASFSYQSESPIRPGTFYFTSPSGGATWNDFAPNNPFRFMIEPRLQDADDIGATAVSQPCLNVVQNSPAFNPVVSIFNYGANPQFSFIVKTEITGPATYSSIDTFTTMLASNTAMDLVLTNTFNPVVAGTYTMKVWTSLLNDLQTNNDTATYQFNVTDINTFTNAGNQLTLNGAGQYGVVHGNGSLNITGSMLTIEGWVNTSSSGIRNIVSKDSSSSEYQYSFYLNAAGNLVFRVKTINGTDSLVSSSTVPLLSYAHVAVAFDGTSGNTTLYINGAEVGTKPIFGSIIGNVQPLYIGKGFSNVDFFGGNIDELRIWDTCRTAEQIRTNMHTRMANFAHSNLKAYWRMDDLNGVTSIADASGNCNAAALIATPTFTTSTIPLGAATVYTQDILSSGPVVMPSGSMITLNTIGQIGTSTYYIHKFAGLPIGTQPTGVTAVNANNWVIYRYGAGTMDSAEISFTTHGILPSPVFSDFMLFNRAPGANGAWFAPKLASNADNTSGTVSFIVSPADFNLQFVVGANNHPLPVQLLYFTGTNNQKDIVLNWATASEINNAGFYIERSKDGKRFERIRFVDGQGNSNTENRYAYTDEKAFDATGSSALYYRLVQTDFSGKSVASKVIRFDNQNGNKTTSLVYPNPFYETLTLYIDALSNSNAKIVIQDITGKKVIELEKEVVKGNNTFTSPAINELAKGMYILQLMIDGETTTHKIIKQ